jgi:hypothetical protein
VSSPADAARADELRNRLASLGLQVDVQADGALAILSPRAEATTDDVDASRWALQAVRDTAVREARSCGFTHVALELLPPTDAHVRRPQPPT